MYTQMLASAAGPRIGTGVVASARYTRSSEELSDTRTIAESLIRERQQRISSRHRILLTYQQASECAKKSSACHENGTPSKRQSWLVRVWSKIEEIYELL